MSNDVFETPSINPAEFRRADQAYRWAAEADYETPPPPFFRERQRRTQSTRYRNLTPAYRPSGTTPSAVAALPDDRGYADYGFPTSAEEQRRQILEASPSASYVSPRPSARMDYTPTFWQSPSAVTPEGFAAYEQGIAGRSVTPAQLYRRPPSNVAATTTTTTITARRRPRSSIFANANPVTAAPFVRQRSSRASRQYDRPEHTPMQPPVFSPSSLSTRDILEEEDSDAAYSDIMTGSDYASSMDESSEQLETTFGYEEALQSPSPPSSSSGSSAWSSVATTLYAGSSGGVDVSDASIESMDSMYTESPVAVRRQYNPIQMLTGVDLQYPAEFAQARFSFMSELYRGRYALDVSVRSKPVVPRGVYRFRAWEDYLEVEKESFELTYTHLDRRPTATALDVLEKFGGTIQNLSNFVAKFTETTFMNSFTTSLSSAMLEITMAAAEANSLRTPNSPRTLRALDIVLCISLLATQICYRIAYRQQLMYSEDTQYYPDEDTQLVPYLLLNQHYTGESAPPIVRIYYTILCVAVDAIALGASPFIYTSLNDASQAHRPLVNFVRLATSAHASKKKQLRLDPMSMRLLAIVFDPLLKVRLRQMYKEWRDYTPEGHVSANFDDLATIARDIMDMIYDTREPPTMVEHVLGSGQYAPVLRGRTSAASWIGMHISILGTLSWITDTHRVTHGNDLVVHRKEIKGLSLHAQRNKIYLTPLLELVSSAQYVYGEIVRTTEIAKALGVIPATVSEPEIIDDIFISILHNGDLPAEIASRPIAKRLQRNRFPISNTIASLFSYIMSTGLHPKPWVASPQILHKRTPHALELQIRRFVAMRNMLEWSPETEFFGEYEGDRRTHLEMAIILYLNTPDSSPKAMPYTEHTNPFPWLEFAPTTQMPEGTALFLATLMCFYGTVRDYLFARGTLPNVGNYKLPGPVRAIAGLFYPRFYQMVRPPGSRKSQAARQYAANDSAMPLTFYRRQLDLLNYACEFVAKHFSQVRDQLIAFGLDPFSQDSRFRFAKQAEIPAYIRTLNSYEPTISDS